MARGANSGEGKRGPLRGHTGGLPGGVLGRIVNVVGEARLVGRIREPTARRDAAGWTQAAGIPVTIRAGERQRHDGVDSVGNREAALLHVVLRKLTVGRDLDTRTLQGRGAVGSDA